MKQIFISLDPAYQLAQSIAHNYGAPLVNVSTRTFPDGEVATVLPENIRFDSACAIIIHPMCPPVHDNFFKIVSAMHAIRSAGAAEIMLVIPYFGYARHDVDTHKNEGLFATVIAMLEVAGMDACFTVDMHEPTTTSFFQVPVVNIMVHEVWAQEIERIMQHTKDVCVVSPDAGGAARVYALSERFNLPSVIFDKKRTGLNDITVANSEPCTASTAVLIDDIIDTGRTACVVAEHLKQQHVKDVYACFSHAVLSAQAHEGIASGVFKKVCVTNTIAIPENMQNIHVIDIGVHIAAELAHYLDKGVDDGRS